MARLLSVAVALAIFAPAPAHAADAGDARQEPSLEGLYSDWSLYGLQENGGPVCYLSSGLERASDPVQRRRQAYVLITNRPAEGRRGVVSVDPGYIYEDGSTVLMTIGRKQFQLVAKNGFAWAQDNEDPQIIAAIRSGSTLVVTGRMRGGPATTDTFSLRGFPKALVALDRACPVAGATPAAAPHKKRKKAR
ncbi:MAG TPA: invasion associated locus B family protein [Alphaproteobacteria bacterium]|jgi:invasion protein IalB|nr:invasion associated locus B family protein [Alphaproteobacteria bacterium]